METYKKGIKLQETAYKNKMSKLFYEKPNINVSHVSGSSNVVIQNSNSTKEIFTNPNFKIVPVFIKEQNKELLKYEIHRKILLVNNITIHHHRLYLASSWFGIKRLSDTNTNDNDDTKRVKN